MDRLFQLFRDQSKRIKLYYSKETIEDPFEKNVSLLDFNPISISALISDLSFSKIQWIMPGIYTEYAKEIIIHKRHKDLLEQTQKIEVNGTLFEGWRLNNKLQCKIEDEYLRFYIYIRKN